MSIKPGTLAPQLTLPLSTGGVTDDLLLGTGEGGRFTLVVFFRGLHCPSCRRQLVELDQRLGELQDAGFGRVVAVSMESAERSQKIVERWGISELPVAYGLGETAARDWGLFISHAIKEGEPDVFNEPGTFILDSDGTVYWSSVASMPFSRTSIDDVIKGITWAAENSYPARGAA
ncbi:peroxiredoxin-like family protein [Salinibacterium sp. G-O1]|uniref:peroxiredoxin-like family protein n=1 Tax=Salinibacterium sp. G-O1 TaxID=3046208 RepID=UPI0024BBA817|nr:peroxiredoxin-like family protein [Salinibacterium sp. G-O1]MDJ0336122.1 peroxiredoxin-like family protein [Salinibacterium sp. G-O1]